LQTNLTENRGEREDENGDVDSWTTKFEKNNTGAVEQVRFRGESF
jgi:hypothetical protein